MTDKDEMRKKRKEREKVFVKRQRKIVGNNIREERQKRGFTIEQFAEFIGLSSSHVGLIERGERSPSFQVIYTVADFFTLTPDEILLERKSDEKVLSENVKTIEKDKLEAIESLIKDLDEDELEFILQNIITFRQFRQKTNIDGEKINRDTSYK